MAIHYRPDSSRFIDHLNQYRSRVKNVKNDSKEKTQADEYRALGKRKTSIADVVIKRGTGKITVNGRDYSEYFPCQLMRESVLAPFYEIEDTNFDVDANVIGGGLSGQAGAIRNAVSICLRDFDPKLSQTLEKPSYCIKDYRVVERKKYGRHKARKRHTW
ncbi:30S ribosomal protein S9 [Thelohanellus kitauei]|uniref:30S ribosomal protein S9 n=1 Tax=Thelohanellus kitauei TaxID=669202 RepID=A0A0C2MMW3_THEKT|nr:30S ribosomal protein S9 [Thelohanellus kitauei]